MNTNYTTENMLTVQETRLNLYQAYALLDKRWIKAGLNFLSKWQDVLCFQALTSRYLNCQDLFGGNKSLMNYILLTFCLEMCKETWLSLLNNTRRDMATQNVKLRKITHWGSLHILDCLYYLHNRSYPHLSHPLSPALPPASLASVILRVYSLCSSFFVPLGSQSAAS